MMIGWIKLWAEVLLYAIIFVFLMAAFYYGDPSGYCEDGSCFKHSINKEMD